MHIVSCKEKTDHILTRIYPFSQYGSEDEFMRYGYAYFELTQSIKNWLGEYTHNWRKGKLRITKYPIDVFDITLIDHARIENFGNQQDQNYKYIKYDSLEREFNALPITGNLIRLLHPKFNRNRKIPTVVIGSLNLSPPGT